jgi:hypothetical protein
MTHVICNPWERTFTLAFLAPLIVFSPFDFFIEVFILTKYFVIMKQMVILQLIIDDALQSSIS